MDDVASNIRSQALGGGMAEGCRGMEARSLVCDEAHGVCGCGGGAAADGAGAGPSKRHALTVCS